MYLKCQTFSVPNDVFMQVSSELYAPENKAMLILVQTWKNFRDTYLTRYLDILYLLNWDWNLETIIWSVCKYSVSQYCIYCYVYCVWWSLNKMWPETETNCCTRADVTLERRTQDPIHWTSVKIYSSPAHRWKVVTMPHSPRITTQCTH